MLRNKVAGTMPGTEIKLTIFRDGSSQDVTATLTEFEFDDQAKPGDGGQDDQQPQQPGGDGKLGLTLQPLTPQTAKQLGLDATEGLVVTDVDESGSAADAGIARGDVILEVNRRPVSSVEDLQSALTSAGDRPVLLLVSRRGQTVYLTVKPR